MDKKRILLMYISEKSGHYHASRAIETAFHELFDDIETLNVNSFHYTNPILEKIINRAYMSVIKRRPEFWGRIYDNPGVVKKTQGLREAIHKYNSGKMRNLLDKFKPDAVICTQAFPCGIVADLKKTSGCDALLTGVLTDYAPHSYWMYDNVDLYFVPSEEAQERLVANGIERKRVLLTGIPIDPKFRKVIDRKKVAGALGLSSDKKTVLIMGGSQGLGPIVDILKGLDAIALDFQVIVLAGINKKLYRYLQRKARRFKKKIAVLSFAENVDELMELASLIITKPGGITISEALAKCLPMLIVKPIPGHEAMNTDHLLKYKLALKADSVQDVAILVSELLSNPAALINMKERIRAFSRSDSAMDIARAVLERIV